MKCTVKVQEIEGEGLAHFLGKPITLFCNSYFYTGTLVGLNDTCLKLYKAKIIYETGPFNTAGWKDAQDLPGEHWYVQLQSIESFGGVK